MSEHAPRPEYPPLTPRQQWIFAGAALVALAVMAVLAFTRLTLIRWWLGNCKDSSPACTWAEFGFEWGWGIALLTGVGLIAFVAHRLTADRLLLGKP